MSEMAEIITQLKRQNTLLEQIAGAVLVQASAPVFSAEAEISPAELARLRRRYGKGVLDEFNAKQKLR